MYDSFSDDEACNVSQEEVGWAGALERLQREKKSTKYLNNMKMF